jgi:hypothetical protein
MVKKKPALMIAVVLLTLVCLVPDATAQGKGIAYLYQPCIGGEIRSHSGGDLYDGFARQRGGAG